MHSHENQVHYNFASTKLSGYYQIFKATIKMKISNCSSKNSIAITCFLLSTVLLIGVGHEFRQARLRQQLIESLQQMDTNTSLELIRHGADPNARENFISQPFTELLARLSNQKGAVTVSKTPALMVALAPRGVITVSGGYDHAKQYIPLIVIVQNGKDDIVGYDPSRVVSDLLQRGADPNARDGRGNTALYYAVTFKYEKCVELLLKHHAEINCRNKEGFTPLMYAVVTGNLKITELLLQNGARINDTVSIPIPGGKSFTKVTAGQMNFYNEKMKPLLKKYGANEVY